MSKTTNNHFSVLSGKKGPNKLTLPHVINGRSDDHVIVSVLKADVLLLHKKTPQLLGKGSDIGGDHIERVLSKYNVTENPQHTLETKLGLMELLAQKMVQLETKLLQERGIPLLSTTAAVPSTSRLKSYLPTLLLVQSNSSRAGRVSSLSPAATPPPVQKDDDSDDSDNDIEIVQATSKAARTTPTKGALAKKKPAPHLHQEKRSQKLLAEKEGELVTQLTLSRHDKGEESEAHKKTIPQQHYSDNSCNNNTTSGTSSNSSSERSQSNKNSTTSTCTQTTLCGSTQLSGGTHKWHVEVTRKQAEIDTLTTKLQELKGDYERLQTTLQITQDELKELQTQGDQQNQQLNKQDELEQQLHAMQITFETRLAEKDVNYLHTNQKIADQYKEKLEFLQETNEQQKQVISDMQTQRDNERAKAKEQQQHIVGLLNELSQQQALTSQVERLQEALERKIQEFERLNKSNNTRCNQLVSENKQLQTKLSQLCEQLDQIQTAHIHKDHSSGNGEAYKLDIAQLQQQLQESLNQRMKLQQLLDDKMQFKDSFEQVLFNELKTMKSAFTIQVNQLKSENDALHQRLNQLTNITQPSPTTRSFLPTRTENSSTPDSLVGEHLQHIMGRCATAESKQRPVSLRAK